MQTVSQNGGSTSFSSHAARSHSKHWLRASQARADGRSGRTVITAGRTKEAMVCKSWLYRGSNEIICSTQKIFQRNRPGAHAYEWAGIRFWYARLTKAALF